MTTTSYPVQGQNLTSGKWSMLLRRQHQGVDAGMTLSLSSGSNDATVATGRCNFLGFELEVTVAHAVTLPAVSSPTTYVIGVRYDPAAEGATDGPLSIVSGVKGSIDVSAGKIFWPIYEVTRAPSQTLNLATVVSYRTTRASLLTAASGVADPDPTFVQGSLVVVRKEGVRFWDGAAWQDVVNDSGDLSAGVSNGTGWTNGDTKWSRLNGVVYLGVAVTLSGVAITANGTGSLADKVMLTLPSSARPKRMWTGGASITLAGSGATMGCDVRIYSDGRVVLTSTASNLTIPTGSVIYVSANYLPAV